MPGGMIWLRHITIPLEDDRIAFACERELQSDIFTRYFGQSEQQLQRGGRRTRRTRSTTPNMSKLAINADDAPPNRPVNKTYSGSCGTTELPINSNVDPESTSHTHLNLIKLNASAPPESDEELNLTTNVAQEPMALKVDRLFRQYLINILEILGNSRHDGPNYCALDLVTQDSISLEDYQSPSLGRIFKAFQWTRATRKNWEKAFDLLFPTKNYSFTVKHVFHYSRLAY